MKRKSEVEIATDMLILVVNIHKYKNISLNAELENYSMLSGIEKKHIKQLVYKTVRNIIFIDYILDSFIEINSLKANPFELNLMRIFISQIIFTNVDERDAFKNTIRISKLRCNKKNTKIIIDVLKDFLENQDDISLPDKSDEVLYLSTMYSYPVWIIKYWLIVYGFEKVEQICIENNNEPTIYACMNTLLISKSLILKSLDKDEIEFTRDVDNRNIITAYRPKHILSTYSYKNGMLFFIDKSVSMIIDVLNPKDDKQVLIMSANNTNLSLYASIYMQGKGNILCLSENDKQISKLAYEKTRLSINNISEKVEETTVYNFEYNSRFDYVVLDAVSTELGLIKKNPFLKYMHEYQEIKNFVAIQKKLLENASRYINDNGKILYSNSTISQHENIENVNWFVENFNFEIVEMHQNLPGVDNINSDGVFMALLRKRS